MGGIFGHIVFPLVDITLLVASKEELRMGSEVSVAMGISELKSLDNNAVMTISMCDMVDAVPPNSEIHILLRTRTYGPGNKFYSKLN